MRLASPCLGGEVPRAHLSLAFSFLLINDWLLLCCEKWQKMIYFAQISYIVQSGVWYRFGVTPMYSRIFAF